MQASPTRELSASPSRRPSRRPFHATPSKAVTPPTVEPVAATAGATSGAPEWFTSPHGPSAASDWSINHDKTNGVDYYYNHKTGESRWERPADFVDDAVGKAKPNVTPATTERGGAGATCP